VHTAGMRAKRNADSVPETVPTPTLSLDPLLRAGPLRQLYRFPSACGSSKLLRRPGGSGVESAPVTGKRMAYWLGRVGLAVSPDRRRATADRTYL